MQMSKKDDAYGNRVVSLESDRAAAVQSMQVALTLKASQEKQVRVMKKEKEQAAIK